MRWVVALSAVCLLAAVVSAQDAGLGTPNLKSPNALVASDFRASLDWRFWDGGNDTGTGAVEYGLSDTLNVGLSYVAFNNLNDALLGGSRTASELRGPGIWVKWVGREVDAEAGQWGWSIVPGVEFLDMEGTNTRFGLSAGDDEAVFTLEVPVGIPDGDMLWLVDPKLALLPDNAPVTFDYPGQLRDDIDTFGTVFGLGLGVVAPLDRNDWWIYGDVTPILSGDNSLDEGNELTRQLPFTVGVRKDLKLAEASSLDLFVTNCSGGTTATSLIAAPDRSIGFGAKASFTW